jgi:hypothetical protein
MALIQKAVHKKKEDHILKDLEASEGRQYEIQTRCDELEKQNRLNQERIAQLETDLEKEKSQGATWTLGWADQLQAERQRRKQLHDGHRAKIADHLNDHINDCWDDIQALNQLKEFDPNCGTLGDPSKSMSKSFASYKVSRSIVASGTSFQIPARQRKKKAVSFNAGKPNVEVVEVEMSPIQEQTGQHKNLKGATAAVALASKLGQKHDEEAPPPAEAKAEEEPEKAGEEEEPELHPKLAACETDEMQRKLLRALHLVQLLQTQNAQLQDDIEQLEMHARMWARVERALMISVVGISLLILVIGFIFLM